MVRWFDRLRWDAGTKRSTERRLTQKRLLKKDCSAGHMTRRSGSPTAHRSLLLASYVVSGTQPSRVVPSFRIRYPPKMQSIYKMQAISNQVMSGSRDYDDVVKKSAHVKVSVVTDVVPSPNQPSMTSHLSQLTSAFSFNNDCLYAVGRPFHCPRNLPHRRGQAQGRGGQAAHQAVAYDQESPPVSRMGH